jgi:sugar/nucleoside kinase (ribokinase family)
MCYDEIVRPGGHRTVAPGSAVLCGALAAARVGKRVAAITRMSPRDESILNPMANAGISTFVIPANTTTCMRVVYPGDDADEREITQVRNAGFFTHAELPDVRTRYLHLAGITDQEFSLDFVRSLAGGDYEISLDIQSFLRRVDTRTGRITILNVPQVREVFTYCTRLKLDIVEAKLLTGTSDIRDAARVLAGWGSRELVITEAKGVLALSDGVMYYEPFTNRNDSGRTGRGDTTFAAYLAWRLDNTIPESLRFAAGLASIKMEAPGPFSGSLQDVLARMERTSIEHKEASR